MLTDQQHQITPPPELVRKWIEDWAGGQMKGPVTEDQLVVAAQAARWGANRELDACLQLLDINGCHSKWIDMLRAARRPKPPSLKEQALKALTKIEDNEATYFDSSVIRRALEQLDD